MEDSQILDLLRRKSPQTTLEVAKAAKMSWHVIQEQLLELQIDGKLDRITVGRQNLWFLKGQKWKGLTGITTSNIMLTGVIAIVAVFLLIQGIPQIIQYNSTSILTNTSQLGQSSNTVVNNSEISGLTTLGETVGLGNLTITLVNISTGSTTDVNESYNTVEKKYYKIYIKVYNHFSRIPGVYTIDDNEVIDVSLEDSLGNSYENDNEITSLWDSLNLFGNSMEILPSNTREGYLIFPYTAGIPEKLIVRIKSGATAEFRL